MKYKKIYLTALLFFSVVIISQEQDFNSKKIGLSLLNLPAVTSENIIQTTQFRKSRPDNESFDTESPDAGSVESWHNSTQTRKPLDIDTPRTSYKNFSLYLDEFIHKQKGFLNATAWINTKVDTEDPRLKNSFIPDYIRPCILKFETRPDSHIFLWGDLHGDVKTLSSCLYKLYQDKIIDNNFTILKSNCYFFFLGDMVDRGQHGIDTLALLFIFATKNPGKVFLIRGNHEDLTLNKQEYYENNQVLTHFYKQLKIFSTFNLKGEQEFNTLINNLVLFYNLLPVAAFVGCNNNYVQCCHGGLEYRYNPEKLLNNSHYTALEAITSLPLPAELKKQEYWDSLKVDSVSCFGQIRDIKPNNIKTFDLGFLWNDFNAKNTYDTYCRPERGIMMGKLFAEKIFESYSKKNAQIKGIIRAHQHNPSMPGILNPQNTGIFSLWNNQVFTTIATSMFIGSMTFIELITQNDFSKWMMKNYNLGSEDSDWIERENTLSNWQNIVIE